jgi:predicted dienelactone hydrolase
MSKISSLIGVLCLSLSSIAHGTESIGFRDAALGDGGERPLHVALWYPTEDQSKAAEIVAENPVFHGLSAIRDAAPAKGAHGLVILSHGYGGSWRNLSWLASDLAAQGFIVAAPDHPGTTTFNKDPRQAARLWERPHDLSRVIDALIADGDLAGEVDAGKIAAIGHSLGGWTVTALAGARFDTQRFQGDCQLNSSPRACALSAELGLGNKQIEKTMADPRVDAFVSLDLGAARGFSPESLAGVQKPFLVLSAGVDIGDMPARLESGYLAENLPKSIATYVEIPDAMHFTFMQLCKPGAAELIEAETPGDGIVCKDGGTRGRAAIHREISDRVTRFLTQALQVKP